MSCLNAVFLVEIHYLRSRREKNFSPKTLATENIPEMKIPQNIANTPDVFPNPLPLFPGVCNFNTINRPPSLTEIAILCFARNPTLKPPVESPPFSSPAFFIANC